MKRIIVAAGALALAGGLYLAPGAQGAECGEGDQSVDVQIGVVCAGGDPAAANGHVYADGNDDNPEPADGYIGVGSDEEETTGGAVVGCASGAYTDDTDDDGDADPNIIVSLADPAGTEPPGEGPCTPAAP